jgi:hypothetical protein
MFLLKINKDLNRPYIRLENKSGFSNYNHLDSLDILEQ